MTSDFKRGCRRALLGTILALNATAGIAATELITNGDFSAGATGFTSDFTITPGFPGLAQVSILTNYFGLTFPGTSNAFLAVNGANVPGANPAIWAQDVSVVAGQEYSLSFRLGGTSAVPTPVGALSIRFESVEILTAAAPAGATISDFSTDFTAASTGTFTLAFVETSFGFGGNDYGLDDISLTFDAAPVPLPAAGAMLVAGLGGLLAFRRRRGSA